MTFASSFKSLTAAAVLVMACAGAAYAKDDIFTAKLQAPAAESRIVARSTVWTCEGDTCVARPNHAASVSACRAFVREAGPVVAYGPTDGELNPEQLVACNASARVARVRAETQQARN